MCLLINMFKLFKTCRTASKCISFTKKRSLFTCTCSLKQQPVVLGIETSCDDTGCAVVDGSGTVLGESIRSQQEIHLNFGGIIPPIARALHQQHIKVVVDETLREANIDLNRIDAIATTVKPGLALSLLVGMNYGKQLSRESGKPFIPIHHMEAHALTIRMVQKVEFPYLVLLISGGHCLISVVKGVDDFLLLGESLDDAPGEALDKVARRLKLRNKPEFREMAAGRAIELAAEKGDPLAFEFPVAMGHYRDCNFSFSGIKNKALRYIKSQEKEHGIEGDGIIPGVYDLCASFLLAISLHLCRRVQRAMDFIEYNELVPSSNRVLVVSGGVACNKFIAKMLNTVCKECGYDLAIPPPHLCTDNGIMIAWNGVEKWKTCVDIVQDLDAVDIEAKCGLGKNLIPDVINSQIRCEWVKLKTLLSNI